MRGLKLDFCGKITADHESAPALTRSVLKAFGTTDIKDAKSLAALFKSRDELLRGVQACTEDGFGLPCGALSDH
jgi:hypothetical protein